MQRHRHCPNCQSEHIQSRGKRRGVRRFFCLECKLWFNVDYTAKKQTREHKRQEMALAHLQGLSFRSLARLYDTSTGQAYNEVMQFLSGLPNIADINRLYADRFGSCIALADGKYISVQPYKKKIPILWLIDYFTHEPIAFKICPSESLQGYKSLFGAAKLCGYKLCLLVSDGHTSIWTPCQKVYPKATHQLCQVHFMRALEEWFEYSHLDRTHEKFLCQLRQQLFSRKINQKTFNKRASDLLTQYQNDPVYTSVLTSIARLQPELQGHLRFPGAPVTTNLIEGYNSQMEDRLQTIDGFANIKQAKIWTNGFLVYKALTPMADCKGQFKNLNGHAPLELALKKNVNMPTWESLYESRFNVV